MQLVLVDANYEIAFNVKDMKQLTTLTEDRFETIYETIGDEFRNLGLDEFEIHDHAVFFSIHCNYATRNVNVANSVCERFKELIYG